jgi:hypothetical protein
MGFSLCLDRGTGPLGLQRLYAGDVAAHFLDARGALELVGRGLKAQVECLALQLGSPDS